MKFKMLLATLLFFSTHHVYADSTQEEIAALKKQLQILAEKIAVLEQKSLQDKSTGTDETDPKTTEAMAPWTDRITFSGDFRYRAEYIDQREAVARNRHRIRMRLAANTQISSRLNLKFRLATGVDDPASGNATFDGGFNTMDFGLDRAYIDYKLTDDMNFSAGKMKNPAYKAGGNQMIWDNDVNPEGLAVQFDKFNWQGFFAGYKVEEFSGNDNIFLYAAQIRKTLPFKDSQWVAGLSYYGYENLQGNFPVYDGVARNNSVDANGRLIYDYNLIEGFLEYQTKLVEMPFSIFGSYVENTQASNQEDGFVVGAHLGEVTTPGSWNINYTFTDVEADAVVGVFNDSNFGDGAPNAKGHTLRANYGLYNNTTVSLAWFVNELNIDQPITTDYDRFQIDVSFKF